jgi:hypothetical protein
MNVVANLLTDCMPFLKSSCLARETCRAFQMARISSFFLSFLLSLEHLFLRQCFVLVSQSHSFDSSWKSWSTCDCGWCILWQCKWCGTTSPDCSIQGIVPHDWRLHPRCCCSMRSGLSQHTDILLGFEDLQFHESLLGLWN